MVCEGEVRKVSECQGTEGRGYLGDLRCGALYCNGWVGSFIVLT